MATILKRKRADGSMAWQVQIRKAGYPSLSESFNSESDARTYAVTAEKEFLKTIGKGELHFQEIFWNSKFSDVIEEHLRNEPDQKWHYIGKVVLRHIGAIKIKDLNKKLVKNYIEKLMNTSTRLGRRYKPGSIRDHLKLMSRAYNSASEDLNLPKPLFFCSNVLPKGWDEERTRRMSNEERRTLLTGIKSLKNKRRHFFRIIVALAVETGARLQELVLAEWSEIDLDKHLWTIPKEHTKCNKNRYIPLTYRATELLKILKKLNLDETQNVKKSTRLFYVLKNPSSTSLVFHLIFKQLGLVNFRFHDLRHEAISRMVVRRRNLSIYEIMKIVGHGSVHMINRYCHLRSDEMIERFRGK